MTTHDDSLMDFDETETKEWIYPIKHFSIEDLKNSNVEFEQHVVLNRLNADNGDTNLYTIVIRESFKRSVDLASRVITSFRLCREGRIGYDSLLEGKTQLPLSELCVYGLPSRAPKNIADEYSISKQKLVDAQNTYRQISSFIDTEAKQDYSIIILALSRFNRTYDEMNIEDMLIDLMICFETLFTNIQDHNKSEPLAKLATALLRNLNEIQTHKMYWMLKQAYKIRNSLVHDGMRYPKGIITIEDTDDAYQDPLDFLRDVKEYARFCLCEYVKILSENNTLTSTVLKGIIRQSL